MKTFVAHSILILLSCIFAVMLSEFILRVARVSYLDPMIMDENRVLQMAPLLKGRYRDEGDAEIQTNSKGYRDSEYTVLKKQEVYRIAVLGDSFTAGLAVSYEKIFTSILERKLNACFAKNNSGKLIVEIMNFGVPGYSPTQEYITFVRDVLEFNPDAVLLAVYTGNDIEFFDDSNPPFHPFVDVKDGVISINEEFRKNPAYIDWQKRRANIPYYDELRRLAKNSHLKQLIDHVRRAVNTYFALTNGDPQLIKRALLSGINPALYHPPINQDEALAWERFAATLDLFQQKSKAHGIAFWIATLSNEIQVYPDAKLKKEIAHELNLKDFYYPDEFVTTWGEDHNVPVFNLAQDLARKSARENVYIHGFENTAQGFGHWNEKGHLLAGEMLADKICRVMTILE